MAKFIYSYNLPIKRAAKLFADLNRRYVKIEERWDKTVLISTVDPKKLIYPFGWYVVNGYFCNHPLYSTGAYQEMPIYMKEQGTKVWDSSTETPDKMEQIECIV